MPTRFAIVGAGLGGLVAHATLRHAGIEPGEITVLGDEPDPAAAWRERAAAIRQRRLRSESDGHCLPSSFPGLAVREARRRRSALPLLASACDRYRPTVDDFLAHVEEVRERSGFDESFSRARVGRLRAVDGGFELDRKGPFRHVLLATGHPGLALPAELEGDPRAVHAYAPHDYARRVAVIGAGMAAATEWRNALEAGAEVTSIRRREPARRPLNVERPLFSKRGLDSFHAAPPGRRVELLQRFGEPSYPPGCDWDAPLERARGEGRFRVAAALDGEEQVICATGFLRGFEHDPLLRVLVADHGLETHGRWIALDPGSAVPALSDLSRTLAIAGVAGQWAYPAGDTLVGMKYAARRFLRRAQRCPSR